MPHYIYKCSRCSLTVGVLHGMNETPEYNCEQCQSKLVKVPSQVNIGKSSEEKPRTYQDAVDESKDTLSEAKEALKGRVWKP